MEAQKSGTAPIRVKFAVHYPEKYRDTLRNYFEARADLKIIYQLSMDVPEFMTKEERKPHLYLMPRYASSKIVTNIDSKVRLEYSKADAGLEMLGGSCSA